MGENSHLKAKYELPMEQVSLMGDEALGNLSSIADKGK